MKLCRIVLILAVLASLYIVALLFAKTQWGITLTIISLFAIAGRKGYQELSAFGTARWAHSDDLGRAGCSQGGPG